MAEKTRAWGEWKGVQPWSGGRRVPLRPQRLPPSRRLRAVSPAGFFAGVAARFSAAIIMGCWSPLFMGLDRRFIIFAFGSIVTIQYVLTIYA